MSVLTDMQEASAEFKTLFAKYQNGTIKPDERATLSTTVQTIDKLLNQSLVEQENLISKIAELEAKKKVAKSWTNADEIALQSAMGDLELLQEANVDTSDAVSLLAAMKAMKTEIIASEAVYQAAQEGVVNLTFASVSDYVTFIRDTRYLNPYYRKRACDDNFGSLMNLLKDINGDAVVTLKKQAAYLKKQLST